MFPPTNPQKPHNQEPIAVQPTVQPHSQEPIAVQPSVNPWPSSGVNPIAVNPSQTQTNI